MSTTTTPAGGPATESGRDGVSTMAEVAARAGVSTATVSRALSGKTVRPELAAAVHQAAAELDYALDRTARSLRRRTSDLLALVLPDIENPFFTALARGVEDVALEAGLSVVLCNSDGEPDKEDRYLSIAESENMAGVILAPASARPRLTRLIARDRAVIVLDRPVEDDVDQVYFDNVALGRASTQALLAQGFQRVACITGPPEVSTALERAQGWRTAMTAAGHDPVAPELLAHANYRVDGGRRAMQALLRLDQVPDAVLATNNLVAVGVLQVLDETRGQRPGVGVGIIGDLPFATAGTGRLSVTPLWPRELGVHAARMFLDRLGGLSGPGRHVLLPIGLPTGRAARI